MTTRTPNLMVHQPMNDTTQYISVADYRSVEIKNDEDLANLRLIADCNVADLCKQDKYPNLLVWPERLNFHNDDIDKTVVFSINGKILQANDILGYIGINDTMLRIHSRFAKNDEEDYFLHYMLHTVFRINLFDLKYSSSNDRIFDFLAYLFPFHLLKALRQGVYKQYVTRQYNDLSPKGIINVALHAKLNTPFMGKVAYRTREYSCDNAVTQLVRHTIEFIRESCLSAVLGSADDVASAVAAICLSTPSYAKGARNEVIAANLKPVRHPYYSSYRMLQKLCLAILNHKKLKYGMTDNKIHGILFRGSWLWEEYLFESVLKRCGFEHPKNKENKGGFLLFTSSKEDDFIGNAKRYPDYYNENFILDAKYKHLDNGKIDRNDLNQIIAYMYARQADNGGFAYPYDKGDEELVSVKKGELKGYGGEIYNIGIHIPQAAGSYADFVDKMKETEQAFIKKLCTIN